MSRTSPSNTTAMTRHRCRRLQYVGVGAAALLVLLACWVGGVTLLNPPPTVELVMLGSSYEQTLAVPPNAFGWNTLEDLCQTGSDGDPQQFYGRFLHLSRDTPTKVTRDFDWSSAFKDATTHDTIVYLSMHGAADDRGPYLLADDAVGLGDDSDRIRLDGLFHELSRLPAEQRKLVVFDVTTLRGMWRLGVASNTFAESLAELDSTIREVPNLVVVCSSSAGQRSWINQPERRTSFGCHTVRALAGQATDTDRDGRITALEAYEYVSDRVNSWAQTHAHSLQQPLLLPEGTLGRERAKAMPVALAMRAQTTTPPTPTIQWDQTVAPEWVATEALRTELQRPESVAPHAWNEHLGLLLRLEEFALAGNDDAVAQLRARLQVSRTGLERVAVRHNLAWDVLAGPAPTDALPPEVTPLVEGLWQAPVAQLAARWAALQKQAKLPADTLRWYVHRSVISSVLQSPSESLSHAAEIIRLSDDPTSPRPSTVHFVVMLDRHLPASSRSSELDPLLRSAIRCRVKADRVLDASHSSGLHVRAVLPWVETALLELDRRRNAAEDRLFASPVNVDQVLQEYKLVEQQYDDYQQRIERIYAAVTTHDEVAAALPRYTDWWANVWQDLDESADQIAPVTQSLITAWQLDHQLDTALEQIRQAPTTPEQQHTATQLEKDIAQQSDQLQQAFAGVQSAYGKWRQSLDSKSGPVFWNNRRAALLVPSLEMESRLRLLMTARPTNSASRSAKAIQMKVVPATAHTQAVLDSATRRLRLAAAAYAPELLKANGYLSADTADALRGIEDRPQQYGNLAENLKLGTELIAARRQSAQQYDATLVEMAKSTGKPLVDWIDLRSWSQHLLLCQTNENLPDTDVETQRLSRGCYTELLARRVLAGCWNGDSPAAAPYFQEAAKAYLVVARTWFGRSEPIDRLEQLAIQPWKFTIHNAHSDTAFEPIRLIGESSPPVGLQLEATHSGGGRAFVWCDPGPGLKSISPAQQSRLVLPMPLSGTTNTSSVVVQRSTTDTAPAFAAPSTSSATLHAFYRGHMAAVEIPTDIYHSPRYRAQRLPRPAKAAVAVVDRSDRSTVNPGDYAVTVVVDGSGSMGRTPDGKTFKYEQAVRALRELMQQLPDGVQVSVWVFGEALGPQKTVTAPEQTIHQLMRPTVWDSSNTKVLDELITLLNDIEPWNESPVASAMLAARQDLLPLNGAKTMVVLTDGADNRLSPATGDASSSELGQVLGNALAGTGISLNVVGIHGRPNEQALLRKEFAFLDQLDPPGQYWEANETTSLGASLRSAALISGQVVLQDTRTKGPEVRVPRTRANEKLAPRLVEPGLYRLADGQQVNLAAGDSLLMEPYSSAGGESFRRVSIAGAYRRVAAYRGAKQGDATLLTHRAGLAVPTEMVVAVEPLKRSKTEALQVPTSSDVWLEYYGSQQAELPQPLEWNSAYGYPASCWKCLAAPTGEAKTSPLYPQLRVWWTSPDAQRAAKQLRAGYEFEAASRLIGTQCEVQGAHLQFVRATVESTPLPTSDGSLKPQTCYTVELSHPVGKLFRVQLEGLSTAGEQHDYYPEIGRYKAQFWPVDAEQLDELVTGVAIVGIDELKAKAERSGSFAELIPMSPSSAGEVPPAPAIEFTSAP
ncbi:VWA domain-containing protein [Aeoliella sp.]|uniref:VWA domain-containing protein n=1 Tax=Aeoliella sp. TaxID=2795800 RepID=UPI003CCB8FF8